MIFKKKEKQNKTKHLTKGPAQVYYRRRKHSSLRITAVRGQRRSWERRLWSRWQWDLRGGTMALLGPKRSGFRVPPGVSPRRAGTAPPTRTCSLVMEWNALSTRGMRFIWKREGLFLLLFMMYYHKWHHLIPHCLISNVVLLCEMVCLNIASRFKQKISKYCGMKHSEVFLPASILPWEGFCPLKVCLCGGSRAEEGKFSLSRGFPVPAVFSDSAIPFIQSLAGPGAVLFSFS